ncbi:MAG: NUDIX domain-containing protein [Acidimicrobiales bacterium]|nr:NUDIX domain-containing protein [Acidimicrobiales bacterium]
MTVPAAGLPPAGGPATTRPELCVAAVVKDGDRLLLVRRGRPPAAGLWSVPGGRVEHGETMAQAVSREVAEETSVVVACEDLVGWVERIDGGRHQVIFDFYARVVGPSEPRGGDDAAEAAWVPLSSVEQLPLVDGMAEFLRRHGVLAPAREGEAR